MSNALEDHVGTVNIGGRNITNLRFADDIDGIAGEENELSRLVNQLDRASTKFGMEISSDGLAKQFSRGPWREEGEGKDRGRSGVTTSRSGQRKHSCDPGLGARPRQVEGFGPQLIS
ncbi:hypothetical protein Pcinc_014149 [Petrolisthes cinctipes]|uniref:Reverse transcriptase domain-containing protein n=1 Tax=Petrolisthes cinctipes TaxID=88211 RepID=A0AAE1KS23_PETCI|nr:hypothetical protein Pcinc_014149 [Petrolisthes cinctipes]